MKALSLKQPYAELILKGLKTIELRNWNTYFRGQCYIHASKTPDRKAMEKHNFQALPTGCIVGKITIVDVKKYTSEEQHQADADKHLASSTWGNYGFILENPIRITPIPAKGKLNFWE